MLNADVKTDLEKDLPSCLYSMAAACSFQSLEEVFMDFSENRPDALGKIFRRMAMRIKGGMSVPAVITAEMKSSQSTLFTEVLELLKTGYESGSDTSSLLTDIADHVQQSHEANNQREIMIAVERYTMIVSCVVFMPLVLGLIVALMGSMDFSAAEGIDVFQGADKAELISNAVLGNHVYLSLFSVIVAFFVCFQKQRFKNFPMYTLAFAGFSNVLFYAVSNAQIM